MADTPQLPKRPPQVARKSVLLVFDAILNGSRKQCITREFLESKKISQVPQTRALLNFLGFLDAEYRLASPIINCRGDRSRFTKFLKARVNKAYRACSFTHGAIWKENREELMARWPSESIEKKPWSNAIACLLALRDLIDKNCDESWLKRQTELVKDKEPESPASEPTRSVVEPLSDSMESAEPNANDGLVPDRAEMQRPQSARAPLCLNTGSSRIPNTDDVFRTFFETLWYSSRTLSIPNSNDDVSPREILLKDGSILIGGVQISITGHAVITIESAVR